MCSLRREKLIPAYFSTRCLTHCLLDACYTMDYGLNVCRTILLTLNFILSNSIIIPLFLLFIDTIKYATLLKEKENNDNFLNIKQLKFWFCSSAIVVQFKKSVSLIIYLYLYFFNYTSCPHFDGRHCNHRTCKCYDLD